METIVEPAADLTYARLFATPRGRAFHLSWMAHAEVADEGVFDALLERVAPPDLHGLVRTHAEDERRHAAMLIGCVERMGMPVAAIPEELRYIEGLRRASGHSTLEDVFAAGNVSIMRIFAMLKIVEERGVAQFPLAAEALRPHDPESADVIEAIIRDERRHVHYAEAISRRYAPDPTTLEEFSALCRVVEEQAFVENQQRYAAYAARQGFLTV